MSEEITPPEGTEAKGEKPEEDQRVPYERFQAVNTKAKEAAERATKLEAELADIRAQLEEREHAGLPELEQLKKALERAEKMAAEADDRATQFEREATNSRKEQWVTAAAQDAKFIYPDLAAREVNLDEIETKDDAERAVKRIAKARPKLIAEDDPKLPGRVLRDGQRERPEDDRRPRSAIDPESEADSVAEGLRQFLKSRESATLGG